jgi:hypothetical protein
MESFPSLDLKYTRTRDSILLAVFEFSNRGGLDIIMIAYFKDELDGEL